MKRTSSILLLLLVGVVAIAAPARPQAEIMGIALDMSRDDARARLQAMGNLEREERKRQEVWMVRDQRFSHLLVGYDKDNRVRYVTAIARTDGPRMRYAEVADIKSAKQIHSQGNHKFTWNVRHGQVTYVLTARGHDPQYLDSYSVKKQAD